MSKRGGQRGTPGRRLAIEPLEERRLLAVWHVPLGASIQSYINQAASGDEIRLAGGTYSNQTLHVINKSLSIKPEESANVVIDAGGQGAVAFFTIADGSTLAGNSSASRITLRNGATVSDVADGGNGWKVGGGLMAASTNNVTVQYCVITQNTGLSGAGVRIAGAANFRLLDSEITQNTASNVSFPNAALWGAGVMVTEGTALIQRNQISGNGFNANSTAVAGFGIGGGGVYVTAGAVATIDNNVIENNDGGFAGGGVNMTGHGAGVISNNTIRNNAAGFGGGIYFEWESSATAPSVSSPNILVSNNTICGNAAQFRHLDWTGWELTGSGGAVGVYGWTQLTLTGNRIGVDALGAAAANTSLRVGGAIVIGEFSLCTLQDNTISYNRVDSAMVDGRGRGGGLFMDWGSSGGYLTTATLTGNVISHNQAANGAGLFLSDCNVTLTGNQILDNGDPTRANYATLQGGGLWLQGLGAIVPQFVFNQNLIRGNRAQGEGGVHVEHFGATGATLYASFNANTIAENISTGASARGGNLYVKNARVDFTNNLIRDGQAWNGAGVLWDIGTVGKLLNNTVVHNLPYNSGAPGGGVWAAASTAPTLVNNIFALNHGYQTSGVALPAYNLSSDADPGFVNWANQDYQLVAGSAGVNAGNPADYAPTDILSHPRDAQPDLGAYEYSNTPEGATVGLYDPTASTFYLRYANDWGNPDNVFQYALGAGWTDAVVPGSPPLPPAGAGPWKPFAGDWNGDGTDTIGLYDPATSWFHLRNSNSSGGHDVCFAYGSPGSGWIPVVGDWDGNGTVTVGLFDPEYSQFYLRNSLTTGGADVSFAYGAAHLPLGERWQPIVSDWDGNATATVGFYDPYQAWFYLHNSHTTGSAEISFPYGAAGSNWMTVMADWNGDNGQSTMGFYLPDASHWYLSNSNEHIYADLSFGFGAAGAGWLPIVGDWDGAGAAALMAAEGVGAAGAAVEIDLATVQPVFNAALTRWSELGAVQVVVTDLPGNMLGQAVDHTIYLDRDAAGHGWFVDPTPNRDEEFVRLGDQTQLRAVDPQAVDRIDLLTVVEHELGHLAGLGDLPASGFSLMSGQLPTGVRRWA